MLKDALNEPDAEEFLKAMVKEVDDHVRREHWRIVSIGDMLASGYYSGVESEISLLDSDDSLQ